MDALEELATLPCLNEDAWWSSGQGRHLEAWGDDEQRDCGDCHGTGRRFWQLVEGCECGCHDSPVDVGSVDERCGVRNCSGYVTKRHDVLEAACQVMKDEGFLYWFYHNNEEFVCEIPNSQVDEAATTQTEAALNALYAAVKEEGNV